MAVTKPTKAAETEQLQAETPAVETPAVTPEPTPAPTPAPTPTPAPAKPKVKTTITIQNKVGPMWHTDLNCWIDGPTEFEKMDKWLQSQINAGKLEVVK